MRDETCLPEIDNENHIIQKDAAVVDPLRLVDFGEKKVADTLHESLRWVASRNGDVFGGDLSRRRLEENEAASLASWGGGGEGARGHGGVMEVSARQRVEV